jgi:hypothetical protein
LRQSNRAVPVSAAGRPRREGIRGGTRKSGRAWPCASASEPFGVGSGSPPSHAAPMTATATTATPIALVSSDEPPASAPRRSRFRTACCGPARQCNFQSVARSAVTASPRLLPAVRQGKDREMSWYATRRVERSALDTTLVVHNGADRTEGADGSLRDGQSPGWQVP